MTQLLYHGHGSLALSTNKQWVVEIDPYAGNDYLWEANLILVSHHHHDHDGHHHADEVFTSWGVETPRRFGTEELQQMLEELGGSEKYGVILRAKGILQNTDGSWMQFDFVPEEYEVRGGEPDYTGRLCVIGSGLKEDALKELFQV